MRPYRARALSRRRAPEVPLRGDGSLRSEGLSSDQDQRRGPLRTSAARRPETSREQLSSGGRRQIGGRLRDREPAPASDVTPAAPDPANVEMIGRTVGREGVREAAQAEIRGRFNAGSEDREMSRGAPGGLAAVHRATEAAGRDGYNRNQAPPAPTPQTGAAPMAHGDPRAALGPTKWGGRPSVSGQVFAVRHLQHGGDV